LRRYLRPQRDAIAKLTPENVGWLGEEDAVELREIGERYTRLVESIESSREELDVSQDELNNRADERINSRLYLLALISAVFLPLGFLTGLLGMNVGGMPGIDSGWGFWVAVGLMMCVTVAILLSMHRARWF